MTIYFRSEDLVILIGAGCSADAGLPTSRGMITKLEELLESKWSKYRDLFYFVRSAILYCDGLTGNFAQNCDIERLVNVLTEIEKKDQSILYPFIGSWNTKLIELASYDFKRISDFIVLECLLNGIWYKGNIFNILSKIESLPKAYLIYRLNKAKQFLKKANSLKGEAKKYFLDLAKVTLGEIKSLLNKKTTLPKGKINIKVDAALLINMEKTLSEEGERIWIN